MKMTSSSSCMSRRFPPYKPPRDAPKFAGKDILKAYAKDPPSDRLYIAESDHVVIYDGFPKAQLHLLVLPKMDIKTLTMLKKENASLLRTMLKTAKEIVEWSGRECKIGFHRIPSMSHLHMHIISKDMRSPALKTKKHYNSYATRFFISADDALSELESRGCIRIDPAAAKKYLGQNPKCMTCGEEYRFFPELKKHLDVHGSP